MTHAVSPRSDTVWQQVPQTLNLPCENQLLFNEEGRGRSYAPAKYEYNFMKSPVLYVLNCSEF